MEIKTSNDVDKKILMELAPFWETTNLFDVLKQSNPNSSMSDYQFDIENTQNGLVVQHDIVIRKKNSNFKMVVASFTESE